MRFVASNTSETVGFTYDATAPGAVVLYENVKNDDPCEYVLTFTASDSNEEQIVRIYSSTNDTITLNAI